MNTAVPFDTVDYDPNGMISGLGTGSCEMTIPVSGYYMVNAQIWASANNSSVISIFKNGSPYSYGSSYASSSATVASTIYSDILKLSATDTLQVVPVVAGFTNSAAGSPRTFMAVHFLSPA